MSGQQQKRGLDEGGMMQDAKQMINRTFGISQILAMPIRVWFSRSGTPGDRYFGVQGAICFFAWPMLVILLMGQYRPSPHELPVLGIFCLLSLCRIAGHNNCRKDLNKQGIYNHSQYGGTSIFTPWAGDDEIRTKQIHESSTALLIGALTCIASPALGGMMIVSAVANVIAMEFERLKVESVKRQMRDAQHEQALMREYVDEVR